MSSTTHWAEDIASQTLDTLASEHKARALEAEAAGHFNALVKAKAPQFLRSAASVATKAAQSYNQVMGREMVFAVDDLTVNDIDPVVTGAVVLRDRYRSTVAFRADTMTGPHERPGVYVDIRSTKTGGMRRFFPFVAVDGQLRIHQDGHGVSAEELVRAALEAWLNQLPCD